MTLQTRASIDVMMRVDDSTGRPVEIDRDVLRRAYLALQSMCRAFYAHHRPPALFPEEGLSMSFYEPSPGAVVFEAEAVADGHVRSADQPASLGSGQGKPALSARQALHLSVHGLVETVRAFGFVLAAPQTVREVRCDHVELTETEGGRRLHVSSAVDYALLHGSLDAQVREFFTALTREGVGAISLSAGGDELRSQIQHMVIATDRVLEFARGAEVPRPIDRLSTEPDLVPGPEGEAEHGVA